VYGDPAAAIAQGRIDAGVSHRIGIAQELEERGYVREPRPAQQQTRGFQGRVAARL
jgi:hypothetical protein